VKLTLWQDNVNYVTSTCLIISMQRLMMKKLRKETWGNLCKLKYVNAKLDSKLIQIYVRKMQLCSVSLRTVQL